MGGPIRQAKAVSRFAMFEVSSSPGPVPGSGVPAPIKGVTEPVFAGLRGREPPPVREEESQVELLPL